MKKCENCGTKHDGSYGSGRFCSSKCARGFSTKEKRSLINEKVSKTLSKNTIQKTCLNCGNIFFIKWNKRNQKTCSKKCARNLLSKNEEYIKKLSLASISAHLDGKMKGSSKSIKCIYNFKNKKIRCDSKVEYTCLNYFETNYNIINIERCNFFIEYQYEGKVKRYLPDFKIETEKETFIIECKCFFKITEDVKNSKSWSMYYNTIKPKREALINYCSQNNFKEFFFTKHLHRKFYDSINSTGSSVG